MTETGAPEPVPVAQDAAAGPAADARELLEGVRLDRPDVVELARLASVATRVEPQLLRRLRTHLLPVAHAGLEGDVWLSALVESRSPRGFVLRDAVARALRVELAQDPPRLERAWAITAAMHEHEPPSIRLEEEVTYLALAGGPAAGERIAAALESALKAMVESPERSDDIAAWALRALPRLPPAARDSQAAWVLAMAASARLRGREVLPGDAPAGAVAALAAVLPDDRRTALIGARMVIDGLELTYPADPRAHPIEVPLTTPVLVTVSGEAHPDAPPVARPVTLRLAQPVVTDLEPGDTTVSLMTSTRAVFEVAVPAPDLTLTLLADPSSGSLHEDVASPHFVVPQSGSGRHHVTELYNVRDRVLKDGGRLGSVSGLMDVGYQLSDVVSAVFWESLDRVAAAIGDRPPRVLVVTNVAGIPWEVARIPRLRSSSLPPLLGLHVDVGTWVLPAGASADARPWPVALDVGTIVSTPSLVMTPDPSKGLGPTSAPVPQPVTLPAHYGAHVVEPTPEALQPWLSGRFPADLLRVVGQGGYDMEAGMARLSVWSLAFDPPTIAAEAHGLRGLVVLQSSQAGAGGIVEAFAGNGVAAVLAPLWRIGEADPTVTRFVEAFLDRALAGMPPAAVLRELRAEALNDESATGSVFAFQWFGDPGMTLVRRAVVTAWDLAGATAVVRLIGHDAPIAAAAYSPDGSVIATAAGDATVRTWAAATGRQQTSATHGRPVTALAFSPDGVRLAAGSDDGRVVMAIPGRQEVATIDAARGRIVAIAWAADGTRLALASSDGAVTIVDTAGGVVTWQQRGLERVTSVAWSVDGTLVYAGQADGSVLVIEGAGDGGGTTFLGGSRSVVALAACPDGERLAVATAEPTLHILDARTGESRGWVRTPAGRVTAMRYLGSTLVTLSDTGILEAWDPDGVPLPSSTPGPIQPSSAAALAPDGRHAVTFDAVDADPAGDPAWQSEAMPA
jgi:WD domain, G-beta repeat